MNHHTQGLLRTKIQAVEHGLSLLMAQGLTVSDGESAKQNVVRSLEDFSQTVAKVLRQEERAEYSEIADTLLQAMYLLPVPSEPVQIASECALIANLLQAVERMLDTEKLRKIFVFLPYKASMWDSLESIWKAAAEDAEHTEAHVVPIPYADRNPDGSAAAWHCEADDFPDYVPVEDWQDYTLDTLKELRPDAIFIHNPYDGNNYVTSVDAQYYSDKLKECTDCLVYVPYFVSGDMVAVGPCKAPGVFAADYVVLENEGIKKQYESATGWNDSYQKFLAFGSPKFDKVRSTSRMDFSIPKAWEDIIQNRKVVLYLTSLGDMLQNTEHVCGKLRFIFQFFQEHKEYVLWWRPHPLMKSTLKSMRPEYYDAYMDLEKNFVREGLGILDESPELERAIAFSDAYYGDFSSCLVLYAATGKPILQQWYRYPVFPFLACNIIEGTDTFSFFDTFRNRIWTVNRGNGNATYQTIPFAKCWGVNGFGPFFLQDDDKAFLFPQLDRNITAYDMREQRVFKQMEASAGYQDLAGSGYYRAVPYRDSVYFYSWQNPEILKLDRKAKSITRLTAWYQLVKPLLRHDVTKPWPENNLLREFVIVEETLYIALPFCNGILAVCMDDDTAELIRVGEDAHRYHDLAFDGEAFWLLDRSRKQPLVRWNPATGEVIEYPDIIRYRHSDSEYVFLRYAGGNLFIYPWDGEETIVVDAKTGKVVRQEEDGHVYLLEKLGTGKERWIQEEETCIAFHFVENGEESVTRISKDTISSNGVAWNPNARGYTDELVCTLDGFLAHLSEWDSKTETAGMSPCGPQIYQAIYERCTNAVL